MSEQAATARDVFISYSKHNRAIADEICHHLEAAGVRCWIAPRDIPPGGVWASWIIEAIRQSRVLLVVFSSHANASRQVMREVERAAHYGVAILPFRVEDVTPQGEMEYYLSALHWLDAMSPPLERHIEALVIHIRGELAAQQSASEGAAERIPMASHEARKPPAVNHPAPLLVMTGVSKSFGPTRALDGVSLELAPGEVHALIGENGAGKSTLMKILSGAYRPDAGTMTLAGTPYAPRGPRDARRQGVAMIYQELTLAPHLTVEANVMLGQERVWLGLVRRREHRRLVREALGLLEHPDIQPDAIAGRLSVGAQQLVEVARALVSDARVIVFDEPTSSLTERDAARLFEVIARLRSRGLAIVYISHFLEEVRRVAQRYTVLRDGRTVASGSMDGVQLSQIIAAMVGRELTEMFPHVPHTPGEPVLDLSGLAGRVLPRRADLTLRRGEVLGIAGLVGAGRTELLRAIFGLDAVRSGQVIVKGISGGRRAPRHRIAQGVGFLSEDRKGEGLALARSIEDNLTLSALGKYARGGLLNLRRRRAEASRWMQALRVRAAGPDQSISALSGGNQQKVALARLLHQEADVLLLDEPTRGIDVGSKAEIYRMIGELAAQGKAILMVSSYLPELMGICDRLAVMSRGILSEARPAYEWTEHTVMEVATGG
ncbi:MAG TPA: ATP-binding cassette domain-containing protein [Isosphaeraceae bacterium]|nr:ATP-binding cassette domain-containing protein [Isosphaeraceae bacterium]